MRTIAAVTAFISLGVAALAQPPVIRKAPDFTIAEPSGKKTPVSSFKGKVVVVEFLYTTCPHCQKESQMLTKLYKEMGSHGLQILGVAFNDNAAVLVPSFVQEFGVPYPVGAASSDSVMGLLGFSVMDRYVVPQVMVIDRKGNIRAQSPPQGDSNLQDENYMRNLLTSLLKEGAATSAVKTSANSH
jgi:peroxiredoxin